jgi:hypothetical protein
VIRVPALGVLATVATGLAAMAVVALVQLRIDLPPEGPTCDYEIEDASGGSPGGVERIDWGVLPERRCEVVDGPLAGQRFTGTADDVVIGVVRLLAGIGAGSLAGAAVILRLTHRRSSPLVSGVDTPT